MIFVLKRKHKRRSQFHKLNMRVSLHAFCSDLFRWAFNIEILYLSIIIEFLLGRSFIKSGRGDIDTGKKCSIEYKEILKGFNTSF